MASVKKINKAFIGEVVGTDGYPMPLFFTIEEGMPQKYLNWLAAKQHPAVIIEEEPEKKKGKNDCC